VTAIGKMRERVRVTVPTIGTDAMGQQTETWGQPRDVWAAVVEEGAGEQDAYDGTEAKRRIVVTVRASECRPYGERMRLRWRGIDFNAKAVRAVDVKRRFMEIIAEVML
jgi:SPP1 family predicted phage head-tail adaptor